MGTELLDMRLAQAEDRLRELQRSHAASYVSDERGTEVLYETLAGATCMLRSTDSLSADWSAAIDDDLIRRG